MKPGAKASTADLCVTIIAIDQTQFMFYRLRALETGNERDAAVNNPALGTELSDRDRLGRWGGGRSASTACETHARSAPVSAVSGLLACVLFPRSWETPGEETRDHIGG